VIQANTLVPYHLDVADGLGQSIQQPRHEKAVWHACFCHLLILSCAAIARTYRFAVLGMSLSNLLDIQQPHDLLRGILNTMIEYDQSKEEGDKPKKVCVMLSRLPIILTRGTAPLPESSRQKTTRQQLRRIMVGRL
jgi:hypothetical protein